MDQGQQQQSPCADPRMRCQRPNSIYNSYPSRYQNPTPCFRPHSWHSRTYTSQNRIRPPTRPWINTNRYRMPFQPRPYWDGRMQPYVQDNPRMEMLYNNQNPYSGQHTSSPLCRNRPYFTNLPILDQDQDEKYVPMPLSPASSRSNELVYQNHYEEHPPSRHRPFVVASESEDEEYHPEPVGPWYIRSDSDGSTSRTNSSSSFADGEESHTSSEGDDDNLSDFAVFSNRSFLKTSLECTKSLQNYPANPFLPEGCTEDSDSFLEMYVAAVTQYVLVGEKKTERKAAFGVWFGSENELNFAELLPELRPQCLKAVLLFGCGKGISFMKHQGFTRLKVNMDSDFLKSNVADWTAKFMSDACEGEELKKIENWDEYKYSEEIKQLCRSSEYMIVKWSNVPHHEQGIQAAKGMARKVLESLTYKNENFKLYESNTKSSET